MFCQYKLPLALGKDAVQSAANPLSCLLLYKVCSLEPCFWASAVFVYFQAGGGGRLRVAIGTQHTTLLRRHQGTMHQEVNMEGPNICESVWHIVTGNRD